MKIKIILFVLFYNFGFSQSGEFTVYPNGLIYSEQSVNKLKQIVDSLNLKFKVCQFNKVFKAVAQTKTNFISFEKSKVMDAKKDMDNNISFDAFVKKYPKAKISNNKLTTKSKYFDNYSNKNIVSIRAIEFSARDRFAIDKDENEVNSFFQTSIKGKWLYEYREKTDYSAESIIAFYFLDNFSSKPIHPKYSKLIQYADCMVDTTSQVFHEQSIESGVRYYDSIPKKYAKLVTFVNEKLKKPAFNYDVLDGRIDSDSAVSMVNFRQKKVSKKEKLKTAEDDKRSEIEFEKYYKKLEIWRSNRLSRLDSLRKNDLSFMVMLIDAHEESKVNKSSNDEFEEYVSRYISKNAALELKRNRTVVGGCSMDNSPRIHAFNIALLSAETTKWEIFLRSHLNIMNDRFDRVSDGSYAQKGRETYIKELEVLDINVLDLILGISLRVENASINHYYGSINRIGRALAEGKFKSETSTMILDMIKDDELDDYNRVLMYFLFDNYNYSIQDKNEQALNKIKFKEAVSKLPEYILSNINMVNQ